mmetsp:Transcript_32202/g.53795  ORF Transcript_32202/g.53795 Transcript_32202/m.53795 type:complete len:301 (-) Transcript_32202:10-912(-)
MSFSLDKRVELELRELPGNHICCDCDAKNPQWASVSLGVFMCLECSGRHRALGVHISFVRSVSMDSWNDKQIQKMRVGGNDQCINFLKNYGIAKTTPISQKYNTPAAMLYRDRIDAAANGRPLPTELPAPEGSGSGGGGGSGGINSSDSNPAQGVEPLEGESEAQYVARQRRLQEEARERMRKKLSGTGGGSMAGIGSDPNYVPGGGGGYGTGGGDGSAFSFVSSWVDQVSKSTQQLLQENNLTGGGGGGGGNRVSQGAGSARVAEFVASLAGSEEEEEEEVEEDKDGGDDDEEAAIKSL